MKSKERILNNTNTANERLLNPESQKYLTDIVCYLRSKNIDTYEVEIIRGDIIGMFLDAQKRGEEISKVLGCNYKTFCDEILCSAAYKKKRAVICEWADCILTAVLVLVGLTFVFSDSFTGVIHYLFQQKSFHWQWGITAGNLVTWFLLTITCFVILSIATKTSLSEKSKKLPRPLIFLFGAGVMVILLILAYVSKTYLNQVLIQIHLGLLLIVFILGFFMHRLLHRYS